MAPVSTHDDFFQPENLNLPVWRYVDFAKFVSMLKNRALYFSRLGLLGDPFEGSLAYCDAKRITDALSERFPGEAEKMIRGLDGGFKSMLQESYVNCWHLNEHESEAMWRCYGKGGDAIAIRSTYGALKELLPSRVESRELYLGTVRYLDHLNESMVWREELLNFFTPIMYKSRSLDFEKEVRAVLWKPNEPAVDGVLVHVELQELVERIIVAPDSEPWYQEVVQEVVARFGYGFEVARSSIDAAPRFLS